MMAQEATVVENVGAAEAQAADAPVQEPSVSEAAPVEGELSGDAGPDGQDAGRKAISLRMPVEDLARAKAIAEKLDTGYQTLLLEIIRDGLAEREVSLKMQQLVTVVQQSLPELKVMSAEELVNAPAVQVAQEFVALPAIKAAQALIESPAFKAAQDLAQSPAAVKVRDFGTQSANKAAEGLASSPIGKAVQELVESPTIKAAQELASSATAKWADDWARSPGGRLAKAIVQPAQAYVDEAVQSPQLAQLNQAVKDMQQALKQAGLLK